MIDELYVRKEITVAMNKIPDWLDMKNSQHKMAFAYFKECCKILRECVSKNFKSDNEVEELELLYYCYLQDIFTIDRDLYNIFQKRLDLLIRLLNNMLLKYEMYESVKNIQYFYTITKKLK